MCSWNGESPGVLGTISVKLGGGEATRSDTIPVYILHAKYCCDVKHNYGIHCYIGSGLKFIRRFCAYGTLFRLNPSCLFSPAL